MLTKLAHEFEQLRKTAEEDSDQKSYRPSITEDAGYGASLGWKAGALRGGITGAATGGPLGAFPGALGGGISGFFQGGMYGAAGGLGKKVLDIDKPEDRANILHDAAILSALGAGVGVAGEAVHNRMSPAALSKGGLRGAAMGGLFGAGIGYLKDKDERRTNRSTEEDIRKEAFAVADEIFKDDSVYHDLKNNINGYQKNLSGLQAEQEMLRNQDAQSGARKGSALGGLAGAAAGFATGKLLKKPAYAGAGFGGALGLAGGGMAGKALSENTFVGRHPDITNKVHDAEFDRNNEELKLLEHVGRNWISEFDKN